MTIYNPAEIEKKWQAKWEKEGIYTPDIGKAKNPFYNLMMFPYASAEGLHAGNMFAFTGSDVYGRFKRMQGFDVFEPIGLDGFGIHSENYALKVGKSPQEHAKKSEENFYKQLHQIGNSFDWSKTLETYDPDYYRWTQWLFVQIYKADLAYKKKAAVNWCPSCKTVLADEQVFTPVAAGKWPKQYAQLEDVPEGVRVCERCGSEPQRKELQQWFFRITKYADRLLAGLNKIEWSKRVVTAQRNWIGRKEGMKIKFDDIEVFTTRPDTLAGATFVAIPAPELATESDKEKVGKFTGKYVTNPLTGRQIPIWKANYVTAEYGSGAIMGVPAHDARDMEFATKYGIDIEEMEPDPSLWARIEAEGWGQKAVNYHLRDWLISRQRYWGPPIPMIYCGACAAKGECWFSKNRHLCPADWDSTGWYPEENLPVELPTITDYQPEGNGKGPLANHPEFYKTTCPHCGGEATRETDVSDTFVDSSWYFLRYPSTRSARSGQAPFDPEITRKWLPVSLYFGGAEHAVLHLMYARFVTMVLYDLKLISFEEPFPKFFAHGLLIKDGAKMSKSRGNVVNPDEYIAKYGADTLRLYLMFMGPMDGSPDFRDTGIEGMHRFVNRLWRVAAKSGQDDRGVLVKLNSVVRRMTKDIENKHYNTAIAALMELVNSIEEPNRGLSTASLEVFIKLVAPFAPHLAEEMWFKLGHKTSVHLQPWPEYDESLLMGDRATIIVQVNGKLRDRLEVAADKADSESYIQQLALASAKVKNYLKSSQYRQIWVPGKLINFVI